MPEFLTKEVPLPSQLGVSSETYHRRYMITMSVSISEGNAHDCSHCPDLLKLGHGPDIGDCNCPQVIPDGLKLSEQRYSIGAKPEWTPDIVPDLCSLNLYQLILLLCSAVLMPRVKLVSKRAMPEKERPNLRVAPAPKARARTPSPDTEVDFSEASESDTRRAVPPKGETQSRPRRRTLQNG